MKRPDSRARGSPKQRQILAEMLAKLTSDMQAALDQMPDDWDEVEIGWYLVHRAELLTARGDRLRRLAYERALKARRL